MERGRGPIVVLTIQHALGVANCVIVAWMAGRLAGRWAALVAGLACALDPWLLTLECYALTETLTTTLVCATAAIVVSNGERTEHCAAMPARRKAELCTPRAWRSVGLGLLCAMLLLTRPAFQVFVPFIVLAWTFRAGVAWRTGLLEFALVVAVVFAALTPWLAANKARLGHATLAAGAGAHWWSGLAQSGLVDETLTPDELRPAFAPYTGRALDDGEFWTFFAQIDALNTRARLLRDWALRSAAADPVAYARATSRALLWQLNVFPFDGAVRISELDEFMARLAEAGDNLAIDGRPDAALERFRMESNRSALRRLLHSVHKRRIPGVPQLLLFASLLLAAAIAAWKRAWRHMLLWTGCVALVALHAAMLLPDGRYSLPVLSLGWVAAAYAWRACRSPRSAITGIPRVP